MLRERQRCEGRQEGARPPCGYAKDVFVGESAAFRAIIKNINTVAARQCPVVLVGETGTGKEIVARQIHARSCRSDKIFIPVDCTSLSGQLFESQLFGHMKGSFTGAISDTLGFFRAANSGTIFLDEIGEMAVELQAKLLRVLQECTVVPVGSTKSYPVDVRVICATNKDLKQVVLDGKFRSDLYFRLNVVQIDLPPLRDRKDDVIILSKYFLERQARLYDEPSKLLSDRTLKVLLEYDWPGNVRELANVMEHAYILSESSVIEPSALPSDVLTGGLLAIQDEGFPTMDKVKKRLIVRALEVAKGRKMAAAELLGIDHRKLARLIKKYNLQPTWKG